MILPTMDKLVHQIVLLVGVNMDAFWDWLYHLNRFSGFSGCLYFILFVKSRTRVSGILFLILFFSLMADNLNYFFIHLIYPNSFYIGNSWHILNYILSITLFYSIFDERKKILIFLLVLFSIGTMVSFVYFFDFSESNTFIRTYPNITLIFLSLLIFLELLKRPNQRLQNHPLFWIATSFFVYNSLLLLQGIFKNYLVFDLKISSEGYAYVEFINLLANISKNVILFYIIILIDKGYPSILKAENRS